MKSGMHPGLGFVLLVLTSRLAAQMPPDLARERADYLAWLTTAANSPMAAVAQQPLGDGVRLGPADSDIPLAGLQEHRLFADGRALMLEEPTRKRQVLHGSPVQLGTYTVYLTNSPTGTIVTVFGTNSGKVPPGYYSYEARLVFSASLVPPQTSAKTRVLAANGITTEASEAGSVLIPLAGGTRLRVLRIPAGEEESELEIFFQDQTNSRGSYPAGRFVSLIPLGGEKYRVDFNRARNPFCAYSPVYPCPAPWRGNVLRAQVRAGERYAGGGLKAPPSDAEVK